MASSSDSGGSTVVAAVEVVSIPDNLHNNMMVVPDQNSRQD